MMPALPALWQLQGSQPAAVFRGKCTCWGVGAAPSFCMSLPDSMGQWSQIKKKKTELRERKRREGGEHIDRAGGGRDMDDITCHHRSCSHCGDNEHTA